MKITRLLILALLCLSLAACESGSGDAINLLDQNGEQNQGGPAEVLTFRTLNSFPHQTDAFTQGLVFNNGRLFESTGLRGQSSIREIDLNTGNVLRRVNLADNFFAEGLAVRGGILHQLTLNSGQAFRWNHDDLNQLQGAAIPNPAWGLTLLGNDVFALSDGTSTLRFLSGGTLTELGTVVVTDNGEEVDLLNELEFINGLVYANRFTTNEIVAIDPNSGIVQFRVDLTNIIDRAANGLGPDDVLNGIAFDPLTNRLFVTGKRWPTLFQIELVRDL